MLFGMARKKLGEMLIDAGVIDASTLRAALAEQQRWGGSLGRALVEMRLIDENTLIATLGAQLHLPTVDLDQLTVPAEVLALVNGELCERHARVPFAPPFKFLDVAMSDATNLGIIDELRIRTQLNVRPYMAGPKMIERALRRYYGRGLAWGSSGDNNAGSIELAPRTGDASGRVKRATGSNLVDDAPLDVGRSKLARDGERDAEIAALQGRLSRLEALVARDEDVIKKLMALMVDKQLATRDEILERIR